MSTQCPKCGKILLKDDARFCSNCGASVPARPLSSQQLSEPKDAPAASGGSGQDHKHRPAMREQIAQQPAFQPPRRPRPTQDVPPPWISELSTLEHSKTSPPKVNAEQLADKPTASLSGLQGGQPSEGKSTEKDDESIDPAQADTPTAVPVPQKSPVRELHIKVWEQEENAPLAEKPELATETVKGETGILADFPTIPMIVEGTNGQNRPAMPPPILGVQARRFDEVTHFDTERLPKQQQVKPVSQSAGIPGRQPQQTPSINQEGATQRPMAMGQYAPSFAQPAPARRRKRVVPLLFTIILLCVLVAGGLWTWINVFHPFTIPPVTQPQQSFQNAGLGVALSYPNGWMVQLDQNNETAQFSDSTDTARFSIMVVAASGPDAGQYLVQEAKQLGITGAKSGPPLSFAGASWQQVQGSIVQNGVNYTETLLVTMHANRLYSVIQRAPQVTYADEDQVIFSTIRSSFRFLL